MDFAAFDPAVAGWFQRTFAGPTAAQEQGWAEIAAGRHTLIEAPTGSGKTLAAFLWCLNDLVSCPPVGTGVSVLYVSPLKALNNDIRRNLEGPLAGIRQVAAELGRPAPAVSVDVRTGDTLPSLRTRQVKRPPDVLITTPESLYLLLTARRSQKMFNSLRYLILDEIHSLAGSKRGVHLALSLERLEELRSAECRALSAAGVAEVRISGADPHPALSQRERGLLRLSVLSFVRIGLSATQRPLEVVGRLLGGFDDEGQERPVSIVRAQQEKRIEVDVTYPFAQGAEQGDFMAEAGRLVFEEMAKHRSMLVFCNARHTCEQLSEAVNNLAGKQVAIAHHGSIARERRFEIEQDLKEGRLPLLITTSSLELGIDIGSVDFVMQLASPKSVNRALQRLGRSGHAVGAVSKGRIIARFPADLLDAAACARGVKRRSIESTRIPHQCLDVLAQHVVAMVGSQPWKVDDLLRVARRAEPFHELSRAQLENVLAMLDGRFADARFADLKPRLAWDEDADEVRPRPGALRTSLLNGGTIPDRGYFSVELAGGEPGQRGKKLGELDEEFASELYVGGRPVFALGTSVWGVEAIDRDRVLVRPAPGEMFQIPFWRGERLDRPMEYAVGALAREVAARLVQESEEVTVAWLGRECGLERSAAAALVEYVRGQEEATGQVPSDRNIIIESFSDEIGDGRLVIHSLFGGRVNGAWAFALRPRLREALGGIDPQVMYNDDGIILRIPPMDGRPPLQILDEIRADTVEEFLIGELADAPMLALRFRESAQRALLLPKNQPQHRSPLWLRRQRAADLLSIVRRKMGFPILQEAVRECLHDTWDLNGLRTVLRGMESGEIGVTYRENRTPSPFAASLVWEFGLAFLEAGDVPRGECRAAYLALNRDLLRETLETEDLRSLLDADVIASVEAELAHQALDPEHVAELARLRAKAAAAGGRKREEAQQTLLHRALQYFGPVSADEIARRLDLDTEWTCHQLDVMVEATQLCRGAYRPDGRLPEYCVPRILARIHRESLGRAREGLAPVDADRFADFLVHWQGAGSITAIHRPIQTLRTLLHLPLKRDAWQAVLAARFGEDGADAADTVTSRGALRWRGAGADKLELVDALAPPQASVPAPSGFGCDEVRAVLAGHGALFTADIARRLGRAGLTLPDVEHAIEQLEAAGEIANDLFSRTGRWSATSHDSSLGSTDATPSSSLVPLPSSLPEAYASALLARYGVVARDMCKAEKYGPRWLEVERVLQSWEWRGRVVRGNFVQDLAGPQFALREAVDVLREGMSAAPGALVLLPWEDPANAWGRLLPYPSPRGKGRFIVLGSGRPVLTITGWGRELTPGPAWDDTLALAVARAVCQIATTGLDGSMSIERWQGGSVLVSPMAAALKQVGFQRQGIRFIYRAVAADRRRRLGLAV